MPPFSRNESCYRFLSCTRPDARYTAHVCQIVFVLFHSFCFSALWTIICCLTKRSPIVCDLHVISQVSVVCLFATVYYFSNLYICVWKIVIWPFCETVFAKGSVLGREADGTDVNLRTSKWNSLHLIFIFLNNGEMMPIIYASCIAKMVKLTSSVCFVNIYTYI